MIALYDGLIIYYSAHIGPPTYLISDGFTVHSRWLMALAGHQQNIHPTFWVVPISCWQTCIKQAAAVCRDAAQHGTSMAIEVTGRAVSLMILSKEIERLIPFGKGCKAFHLHEAFPSQHWTLLLQKAKALPCVEFSPWKNMKCVDCFYWFQVKDSQKRHRLPQLKALNMKTPNPT